MNRHLFSCAMALLALSCAQSTWAQSSKPAASVLCRSNTGKTVVTRTRCKANETRVNPGSFSFDGCAWKLGTSVALAGQTGSVTIAESCPANQVLVNHALSYPDLGNNVVPQISMLFTQPVGATHTLPQGVSVRLKPISVSGFSPPIPSGENISAELDLLCCPFS